MSDKTAIPSRLKFKKKVCRFCSGSLKEAGYRDYEALKRFTSDRGKILPRRITGCCAKHQRKVSKAIKQARNLALLPYVAE
ncbi:MAG: 30S ribosomal protein S18 [Spirochaetes bacterium]|nr:30S ribosomal protein S18 [Spirochaetota bacterium]